MPGAARPVTETSQVAPSRLAVAAEPTAGGIRRILAASLVGTAIEYFDFTLYGTAAALVFGETFFPKGEAGTQQLEALATFVLAYPARTIGSVLFGHFGDRVGRKATLVASLTIMGVSTVLIGCLPTHASIGWWAPAALCLLRCVQGFGFGGDWGGAALLAVENAPPGWQARYGVFPQIGALVGGLLANLCLLLLTLCLNSDAFKAWGWRVPFLASALLVGVGLYVRLKLTETRAFQAALKESAPERLPLLSVLAQHSRAMLACTFAAIVVYVLVYLTNVFFVSYGVRTLGYTHSAMLLFECIALGFGMIALLVSALAADRFGPRMVLLTGMAATILSSVLVGPMLSRGTWPPVFGVFCLGLALLGWVFGPMGAAMAAQFPTRVRYSGIASAYNIAGVLGTAGAPFIMQKLAALGGIGFVGVYLAVAAVLGFLAVLAMPETGNADTLDPHSA